MSESQSDPEPPLGDPEAERLLLAAWEAAFFDIARSEAMARAAAERAQAVGDGERAGLAQALALLGPAQRGEPGEVDSQILQLQARLVAAGGQRGPWLCEDLRALLALRMGDIEAARRRLADSDALPAARRGLHERHHALYLRHVVELHAHAYDSALPMAHRQLALARATGLPALEGLALSCLATVHGGVMDCETSEALFAQAVDRLPAVSTNPARLHALGSRIVTLYGAGQRARAGEVWAQWQREDRWPEPGSIHADAFRVPMALGELAAGDVAAAEALLERELAADRLLEAFRVVWHWARGWLLLAQGRPEEAEATCRDALRSFSHSALAIPLHRVQLLEVIRTAAEQRDDYRAALEAAKAIREVELPLLAVHARVRYLSLQCQLQSRADAGDTPAHRQRLRALERMIAAHEADWNFTVPVLPETEGALPEAAGLLPAADAAPPPPADTRQFVAQVSHEIRTPLTGVIGLTDMLLRTPLDAQQTRLVTLARTSAHSMMRLLGDILDIAKLEAGQFRVESQPFSLTDLLVEMASLFEPLARERRLALVLEADPRLPGRRRGDAHRLRQVLGNLLSNALKFTPAGEVRLSLRGVDARDAEAVRIEVSDTGSGIAEDLRGRLFEEFAQGRAGAGQAPGTGLGLAISRRLVQAMGGRIGADDRPGGGTVFWLELRLPVLVTPAWSSDGVVEMP